MLSATDALAAMPSHMRAAFKLQRKCILCRGDYKMTSAGTHGCTFHPANFINTRKRLLAYTELELDSGPRCVTCDSLHLSSRAMGEDLLETERTRVRHATRGAHRRMRDTVTLSHSSSMSPFHTETYRDTQGCCRVDHTGSVDDLLAHPFFAVPMHLAMAFDIAEKSGVFVNSATQLTRTLVVKLPRTRHSVRVPVHAVYEEMARTFQLDTLTDKIYDSVVRNPETTLSKLTSLQHRSASRRARIRMRHTLDVSFVPFIIVSRIGPYGRTRQSNKGAIYLSKHAESQRGMSRSKSTQCATKTCAKRQKT